ncbi:hypothetical protein D8S78_16175 [Natrialba swarupiae]|nr:hypothetical protein [Natrialba swarupiae]
MAFAVAVAVWTGRRRTRVFELDSRRPTSRGRAPRVRSSNCWWSSPWSTSSRGSPHSRA